MTAQMDDAKKRFAGIVLCGGKSSRMGRAKAELVFGDETMLQRVTRLLSRVVHRIIVVAAADQDMSLEAVPKSVSHWNSQLQLGPRSSRS